MIRHASRSLLQLVLVCWLLPASASAENAFPLRAQRILFLGDSITHAGQYVAWIETQLRLQELDPLPEFINIGLGSETCSGLSEPDHPFPRPDVHERLDRALAKVRPDVVVACYGMNDGIYHPFGEERFAAYQAGVNKLIDKVHAAKAKIVLMTPPPFDPVPLRDKGKLKGAGEEKYAYFAMYENYDDVLARYGKWIMQQKDRADMVIDLHGPMTKHVAEQRKKDPSFTVTPDGIHPNAAGHRILGDAILWAWGVESSAEPDPQLLKLVNQRTTLLHDAWLSEVGHLRPGVKSGLPLPAATAEAKKLEIEIQSLVDQARKAVSSQRDAAEGRAYAVHFPASLNSGKLRLSSDYFLWIPGGVRQIRGVIVHQHGCGAGASLGGRTAADDLHWQALARKWDCALMGSGYEPRDGVNCRLWCDPRNGSDEMFQSALEHFAKASGHGELRTAPWCLWGHSGGGFWASLMQVQHPERIVAIWLRSGTAYGYWTSGETAAPEIPAAAYGVPVLGNPGLKEKGHERFHRAWDGLIAMQAAYREQGAFFEFAPDPRTGHECGDSRYLAIPFFDFWLEHRLPAGDAADQSLRPAAAGVRAWPAAMSSKLAEYIETGGVQDETPPPAPHAVTAQRNDDGSVTLNWQAHADLESGIQSFVIERDGERIGQIPEQPVGRFGRPLFQTMSYHDTPEAPLPALRYVDQSAPAGILPNYSVRTINSVGLRSEPGTVPTNR